MPPPLSDDASFHDNAVGGEEQPLATVPGDTATTADAGLTGTNAAATAVDQPATPAAPITPAAPALPPSVGEQPRVVGQSDGRNPGAKTMRTPTHQHITIY